METVSSPENKKRVAMSITRCMSSQLMYQCIYSIASLNNVSENFLPWCPCVVYHGFLCCLEVS